MRKEILVKKRSGTCFNITANRIDSVRLNRDVETSVRVYENGFVGVAGKIGKCDLAALEAEAIANLGTIPYPDIPNGGGVRSVDAYTEILPAASAIDILQAFLDRLAAENPEFLFSNKIRLNETEKTYTSTDGTRYAYHGNSMSIELAIKRKGSPNIMDEVFGVEVRSFDADKLCADLKQLCDGYLRTAEFPKEDLPILADLTILQIMAEHLSADLYANRMSLFSDRLGEPILSEKLGIVCDRNCARNGDIPFFDAEGVVCEDDTAVLVERGRLVGLLTSKRTAAKAGLPITGTAASDAFSAPQAGGGGLTVRPTIERAKLPDSIFVSVTSGGDMTPDGTVSLPVQSAYLVRDGKIFARLPGFTVTGNGKELLGKDFLGAVSGGVYHTEDPYLLFHAKLVNKEA